MSTAAARILVIDDDPVILRTVEVALQGAGLSAVTAASCATASSALAAQPDFAVVLCDHLLPDGRGVEFLREIKRDYPLAVRLLMTGAHVFDRHLALQAINSGEIYRFVAKPFTQEELVSALLQGLDRHQLTRENLRLQERLHETNLGLRQANDKLAERVRVEERVSRDLREEAVNWRVAFRESVDLCLHIMQRLDRPLHAHSQRVAQLAAAIGRDMGADDDLVRKLELAGALHDLALVNAPPGLLALQRQPARATTQTDLDLLHSHPLLSAELVGFLPHRDVIEAIAAHHEHYDGSGYPGVLRGDRLAPLLQILIVADAYEEAPVARELALGHLELHAGRLFPAEPVRSLSRLLRRGVLSRTSERGVLLPELVAGMKLAAPIYTSAGMLLVRQGQVLNDALIRKLHQHNSLSHLPQSVLIET